MVFNTKDTCFQATRSLTASLRSVCVDSRVFLLLKSSLYVTEPIERAPEVSDFKFETVDIDLASVANEKGAIVLENLYISLDP